MKILTGCLGLIVIAAFFIIVLVLAWEGLTAIITAIWV